MPFISKAQYVFHEHKILVHASLLFTINIEKAEKGPGVFRANPALLNQPNYKTLINNVIRFSVIDDIKTKNRQIYIQILDNFNNKIAIQEEIVNLEVINNKYGWQINDWLNSLKET